ncbi:hypothetical protein [Thalassomonas haliotis]|uniref:Uncharacterized protein n=1 Tax=Thalassomonas haliotis TaxID=485448 RepID=A0ABY7VE52_9GAMM|nr:hypothetical protein [Thalassomonas haliotis]WDE11851.1 hypothetical protein H3N35_27305 [Thalassomonas haliotis]
MNSLNLKDEELELVKEALGYYKDKIINYSDYPDYEFKQKQLERVDNLLEKLRKS